MADLNALRAKIRTIVLNGATPQPTAERLVNEIMVAITDEYGRDPKQGGWVPWR